MDEFMKGQLRPDEEILWTGSPHNVQLFEKTCKPGLLMRWAICLVFVAMAAAYTVYATGMGFEATNILIVCSVVLLCTGAAAVTPVMVTKSLGKSYTYYITNKRFIAYKEGVSPRIDWREIADVAEIAIEMIDKTHGNIYLGGKTKAAVSGLRTDIRSNYSADYKNTTLVFCSIDNAADVYDFFPSGIKVGRIMDEAKKTA